MSGLIIRDRGVKLVTMCEQSRKKGMRHFLTDFKEYQEPMGMSKMEILFAVVFIGIILKQYF